MSKLWSCVALIATATACKMNAPTSSGAKVSLNSQRFVGSETHQIECLDQSNKGYVFNLDILKDAENGNSAESRTFGLIVASGGTNDIHKTMPLVKSSPKDGEALENQLTDSQWDFSWGTAANQASLKVNITGNKASVQGKLPVDNSRVADFSKSNCVYSKHLVDDAAVKENEAKQAEAKQADEERKKTVGACLEARVQFNSDTSSYTFKDVDVKNKCQNMKYDECVAKNTKNADHGFYPYGVPCECLNDKGEVDETRKTSAGQDCKIPAAWNGYP